MKTATLAFDGEVLDRGMVVGFRAPASFTGEDVVELHTHGGRAVVQAVLDALVVLDGVRMALPGEFSRRAVLNGKMDVTQAEGIADMVAATTAAQRRQALRQLDGALGLRFEEWRQRVLALLAQVEAAIDFPDEELDILAEPALVDGVHAVMADLQAAVGERAGERVREGVALAIVGRPNAGKSTFLNLLAGRDVAIVSPIAGTTRDVVASHLDIGGYPVVVSDTAGLRLTDDVIEAEGVRRALAEAERADVVVAVVDGQDWEDETQLEETIADLLQPERSLIVVSKADLVERDFPTKLEVEGEAYPLLAVNLKEPEALGRIVHALEKIVERVASSSSEAALLTRERHRAAVHGALAALGRALVMMGKAPEAAKTGGSVAELAAQDLRDAAAAIGDVTGRTSSEDVLDVVFRTFCIGK
jgi:tRNA modification GTPase